MVAIAIILMVEDSRITIFLIILLFVSSIIVLYLVGRKRDKELDEIKTIINNIRKNRYQSSDEIELSKNLVILQREIKKMHRKTTDDIESLNKLQQVRTEFLGNVSHELRTPIFAIQGYVETLLDGAINDSKVNKQFLDKANQHTISLSNLLNDLIDISMIESGEMKMSFRYFRVNEFLRSVIAEQSGLAEKKNIEIVYKPVRETLELYGDKDKLKQVVVNLLQNAIKYTEKGKVELQVEEEKLYGKIIIRDTGIGIPPEDLERIFERFYRVDKMRSRSVGGTGLGLAIVKHILEAHGSTMYVKSEVNKGSEFSFKLKK
jgi:two-component system phosphate regulon sensor histidine kinase PhoR